MLVTFVFEGVKKTQNLLKVKQFLFTTVEVRLCELRCCEVQYERRSYLRGRLL